MNQTSNDELAILEAACANGESTIATYNRYTGRAHTWVLIKRTKHTITVRRLDWATGKMVLRFRPTTGRFVNEYSGESTSGIE